MGRTFFFAQIQESDVIPASFFHLAEAVHPIHIRKQHGLHHHEVIVALISAMRLQVFLQIYLLNNLKK